MQLRIHTITVPTPFLVGPINVYLLEGEPLTLVDAGPKTPEALEALQAGLASHGYQLADIEQVVLTHSHHDHFGLAATIRAASDAKVAASGYDAALLGDHRRAWGERNRRLGLLLLQLGLPSGKKAEMDSVMSAAQQTAESVGVDHPLSDGDTLRAGGADWLVLHTPGHSLGHICLYQAEAQVLISGDHLLGDISSNPILEPPAQNGDRPRSLVRYLESLRRTAQLEAGRVLPAHGKPIADHRALIAQRIAFHDRRKEDIRRLVMDGPTTAYEISRQLFPSLRDENIFLGVSEVVGHLDLLEIEGALTLELRDGTLYYGVAGA